MEVQEAKQKVQVVVRDLTAATAQGRLVTR